MASSSRDSVDLYCTQCSSHLGIFENEWTRLTAGYMRPARPGQHFGTEVGQKTQIVPEGSSQQAARGCTMAEVFCKKCSATVARYCTAAPHVDQRHLVNQYFYKLSKTHLTTSRTEDKVDPVFTFAEMSQPTTRSTHPPAQSDYSLLPPSARASQVNTLRASTQPYQRSYTPAERSLLRNGSHYEPEEFSERNWDMYDHKLRFQQGLMDAQEKRIQEQDIKLQTLSNQLDLFKRIVQDLQFTVSKLQKRSPDVVAHSPDPNDFVGKLEHLVSAMKKAHSRSQGSGEHIASTTLYDSASHSPMPGQDNEPPASLGKRKRGNNDTRQASPPRATHPDDLGSLNARLETTSRSVSFADSSQNSDDQNPQEEESTGTSFLSTDFHTEASAASHKDAPGPAQLSAGKSSSLNNTRQEHHPPNASITDHTSFEETPNEGHIEFSDNDMESSTGVVDAVDPPDLGTLEEPPDTQTEPTANNSSGDTEGGSENARKRPRNSQSNPRTVADTAAERLARSLAPEPTKRRRTLPRTLPSPQVATGLDHARILTPATVEQERREAEIRKDVPKASPTPVLQSTEKLLNIELKELGLEAWIGKNKQHNAEYRKVITAARAKKREENKRAKLAKLGFAPAPPSDGRPQSDPASSGAETPLDLPQEESQPSAEMEHPQPAPIVSTAPDAQPTHTVDEVNQTNEANDLVSEAEAQQLLAAFVSGSTVRTLNGESIGPADPPKEPEQTRATRTRGKAREAELRRRSQLAQQAMEMEA
ncbi:hypothetical protein B0A52_02394 [Exophiala mesophila]|uniref:Yippee domain-containing protein n=1 Tax=Exophiala mesophila TaxID=212818 RepID=A0A438NCW9_EXOME|nr:hypothetical protein B0A52_02394 [Exophiala mesophila]